MNSQARAVAVTYTARQTKSGDSRLGLHWRNKASKWENGTGIRLSNPAVAGCLIIPCSQAYDFQVQPCILQLRRLASHGQAELKVRVSPVDSG